MRFFTCLTDDHNLWLVGLAAGLCLIGSIITFRPAICRTCSLDAVAMLSDPCHRSIVFIQK